MGLQERKVRAAPPVRQALPGSVSQVSPTMETERSLSHILMAHRRPSLAELPAQQALRAMMEQQVQLVLKV